MKEHLTEWLNMRIGAEKPKDAMEAHQLAKHYYHIARRDKMFGKDCTENMKLAKKFYELFKEMKSAGDDSDNDTLEEVDVDNEIENFSEDINEAGYVRPELKSRDRKIGRKSAALRGKESVSTKTTTRFKQRHAGKTVAARPGTAGVARSTGAAGDKRALGGQTAILKDLHDMPEDEFRRKHRKSKSAARTALRREEMNYSGLLPENSISVSMHPSGTKYKVHGVHKSIGNRIKPGEHLSDTHIDDLRDSGIKIRHVKPPKPTPKTAKPAVMGYRKEEKESVNEDNEGHKQEFHGARQGGDYTKSKHASKGHELHQGGDRGGLVFSGKHPSGHSYTATDHDTSKEAIHKAVKSGNPHLSKNDHKTIANDIHKHVSNMQEAAPFVKEDDEGWYTHNQIHGDKGVSRADWKKGIRLNRKGERVNTSKPAVAKEESEPTHAVTYTKGTRVGARSHRTVYVTADHEDHAEKVARKHPDHPGKGWRVTNVRKESVNEGGMKRMATQDAEKERLGAKKVKGTGMKTFKKKPPVKEYGVDKEREQAAKGDRYEEKEVSSLGTPLKKKRSWNPKTHKLIVKSPGGGVKVVPKSHPAPHGTAESVVQESKDSTNLGEHAPEVVEYIPHAYNYNRRSWEDSLAEVNRYKGRSGHRVTKPEKEEPEHIIMQMRKVKSLGSAHGGVDFKDGSKTKIDPKHAHSVINRHDSSKPAEKEKIARTAAHSHDGLKHVASGKPIDDKSPGAPPKPMFKAAARREPLRRVRHPDDE